MTDPFEQVIREVEALVHSHPLALEYEADGRYVWPERWKNTLSILRRHQQAWREANKPVPPVCECDHLCRRWDPTTGRCQSCGRNYAKEQPYG